jgi:acetoin utilization deacetylase AcuC-like enzyme
MRIAYHPNYVYPLPQNHRFPMEKYDLIKRQLIHEGLVTIDDFFEPNNMVEETITKVHDENYWKKLKELQLSDREQRISGFIHSSQLIEREITIMEGTRQVAENSLKNGLGFNIAGGTHHAFTNRGEGFCLLNDQVIAAKWLLENKLVENVLIMRIKGRISTKKCCYFLVKNNKK